jgi:hypothetical protein
MQYNACQDCNKIKAIHERDLKLKSGKYYIYFKDLHSSLIGALIII